MSFRGWATLFNCKYNGGIDLMIVRRVAIGNSEEAFVGPCFSDGKNLVYSNDNNKGKTIILQSIVFALGNEPLFPKGFDYAKYLYYIEIVNNGVTTFVCRKKDLFFVYHFDQLYKFDGESEFKKWFDKNVFFLPKIVKNNQIIVADFELFTKVFYLGQDRRDTSSLSSSYFKKEDFTNMIYSMSGCSTTEIDEDYKKNLERKKTLLQEKKNIVRKTNLLKTYSKEADAIFDNADKENLKESLKRMEIINTNLSLLKRRRIHLYNRLSKNKNVLSEIASIRKSVEEGRFVCGDCGSANIKYYLDKDVTFDVSNDDMRKNIICNLNNTINAIEMEINEVDAEIEVKQSELKEMVKDESVNPVDLIILKPDIVSDLDYDNRLKTIRKELSELENALQQYVSTIEINKKAQKELDDSLKTSITEVYRALEDNQNEQIDALFTKGSELYSGSESTVFLISRLIAFQKVIKHNYPLIIDGYREGEVSTPAEKRVIDYLKNISNQSIITATFKDEEYHKYDNDEIITRIDLSDVESKHLLNKKYADGFAELLKKFSIVL